MSPVTKTAALGLLAAALAAAAGRPKILGVSHIAVLVSDVRSSRAFYKDFLGYTEPFDLKNPDGSLALTFIKINDDQFLELFPGLKPGQDRLHQVAFYVDNAEALRAYLAANGVKVPERVPKGRIGNSNFSVRDPDGHTVEFVQYEPDGWTRRERGRFLPPTRVSPRLRHIGFLVGDLAASKKFYGDLLGFQETWRGSRDNQTLNWVNMKVPDGDDYVEFMLYSALPAPDARGTANHMSLEVADIEQARAALAGRAARAGYSRPLEIRTGINRKRQLNLYDPDGTRAELMEPQTVDGKPAPASAAPPPGHNH
jgi:lactoylglutathione lyase